MNMPNHISPWPRVHLRATIRWNIFLTKIFVSGLTLTLQTYSGEKRAIAHYLRKETLRFYCFITCSTYARVSVVRIFCDKQLCCEVGKFVAI
jgi:hypothetical protein